MIGGLLKTTSTVAILAAAGILVGGVTLTPTKARAADLGGDCCADLEERVAELEATTVRKGNRKVSLTITGRVAATMTYWVENSTPPLDADEAPIDHKSDLYFGDRSGNGPQLIFKGDAKISSDVSAGYYIELGITALNGGTHDGTDDKLSGNTQGSHEANGAAGTASANTYVFLTSKSLGTLQLGKIDSAGDQFNVNFNGSWVNGLTTGRATQTFRIRDNTGEFNGSLYSSYMSTLEHGGENGLRYITPAFGGFSVNASVHGDDKWGVGANFAQTFGTIAVGLGAGYGQDRRVDGNANFTGLSAGIKEANSGLFLQGAWTKKEFLIIGRNDATNLNVQGGWGKNVNGAGVTTLFVGYDKSLDVKANTSEAHTWTVGLDQAVDSAAMNLFLLYENTEIDKAVGGGPDGGADVAGSISALTAGAAIKF